MSPSRFEIMSLTELLAELRASGWAVICHNDYMQTIEHHDIVQPSGYEQANAVTRLSKVKMTFWSFGHECGVFVKGEAFTDTEAVRLCAKAAHEVFAPSP